MTEEPSPTSPPRAAATPRVNRGAATEAGSGATTERTDAAFLRRHPEWLRALAEQTSIATAAFDEERFLFVNPACAALTGYTIEELLARGPADLVHPEQRAPFAEYWRAAQAGQLPPSRFAARLLHRDGHEIWVELTVSALDVGDRPIGLVTAFDVTPHQLATRALSASEERLEMAQRAAGMMTWDWDIVRDHLIVSRHAQELLDIGPEALDGTSAAFFELIHPDDRARLLAAVRAALRDGHEYRVEHRLQSPDGQVRWLRQQGQVFRGADGRAVRMLGVATDVTQSKLAEEAFFQERERALVTLASIADGVIRTDDRGMIDYLNPAAERLTGWSVAAAYGQPLAEAFRVIDPVSQLPLLDPVARCLRERRTIAFGGDRLLVRRDGTTLAVRDTASPLAGRDGRLLGAVLTFRDVTQLRTLEREMSFLAEHDPLTGLLNRRAFEERLDRSLEAGQRRRQTHALLYLDLDRFKLVNDSFGHLAGDELLKQVATRLETRLRPEDTLARLGGDEFGVLLYEVAAPRARQMAQELKRAVEEARFTWQERVLDTTASIGLVPIEGSPERAALLADVDAACYVAKERGGNRVHEYGPGDSSVAERHGEMQWIQQIHRAFDLDRFRLFQQPIAPLGVARQVGMTELFIRMLDDVGSPVPSTAFIAAAERYHLIAQVDRWVIGESFARLGPRGAGRDLLAGPFTLNLSGQSLGDEALLEHVLAELASSGIESTRVCFEITETAAIANLKSALRFISVLKGLGCRFVLDDFGSGLSSFAYLKNLPVDFLKIDSSFVKGLASDRIQRALVESIHQIGRVMGMQTIAEGVEDEATYEVLRDIGIDFAQGYWLARPAPLLPAA